MDLLGTPKPDGRSKSGELVVVLNGLKIENATTNGSGAAAAASGNGNSCAGTENTSPPAAAAINCRSSILSGGIRARMRLRSTSSNNSTTSNQSATGDIAFFGPQTLADLRNARLVPSERRQNEYSEQQPQYRTAANMAPIAAACAANVNRTNNVNWDQSQALVPCSNGVSPNNRSFVVCFSFLKSIDMFGNSGLKYFSCYHSLCSIQSCHRTQRIRPRRRLQHQLLHNRRKRVLCKPMEGIQRPCPMQATNNCKRKHLPTTNRSLQVITTLFQVHVQCQ